MKRPSVFLYLLGNRHRIIPLLVAMVLGVFLIHTLQVLLGGPIEMIRRAYMAPYRHASVFAAKSAPLGSDLVNSIRGSSALSEVYPCLSLYTNIDLVLGGRTGTLVLALPASDLPPVLKAFGVSPLKGRLPGPNENAIALHEVVARNKGLDVGDPLGSDFQAGEMLEGGYTVCGILRGQAILSFTSLEYELGRRNVDDVYSLGALAVPKQGQIDQLNGDLCAISGDGVLLRTLDTITYQFSEDTSGVLELVSMLELATLAILCVCAGFLSYIQFYMRRGEFATLFAIGYTHAGMLRQAFLQIAVVNLAGFALGWLLSALTVILLGNLLFAPVGLAIPISSGEALVRAVCAPLFATVACVVPSGRVIVALDPIDVLEGRG